MPDEKKLFFKFMNKNLTVNLVDINRWRESETRTTNIKMKKVRNEKRQLKVNFKDLTRNGHRMVPRNFNVPSAKLSDLSRPEI
jgi:hypothetical protein